VLIETIFHRVGWLERRLMRLLGTMTEGLRGVRAPRHAIPLALSSAGIWFALALSVWAAMHAAHLDLPLVASWVVLAFLGLGVSLPSSPGFVGVVQAATVLALALFAVPRSEALSFSLLMHASQFFPVTAIGLLCLLLEQVSLTDAAHAASERASSEG
jgi:uncharacterized membrane protein YbhN (UPF0104 family)